MSRVTVESLVNALSDLIEDGDLSPEAEVRIMRSVPGGEAPMTAIDVVTDRVLWLCD